MILSNIIDFTNSRTFFLVFSLALGSILAVTPRVSFAQQPARQESPSKDDSSDKESPATSQVPGAKAFDNITIERIRPENLPETSSKMPPPVVYQKDQRLPGVITQKDLQQTTKNVASAVVQVISIHMPPKPYRQTPMVHRGHAVWLSVEPNRPPVLISTLDWLADAQTIYILPDDIAGEFAARDPNASKGAFRSLDSMTVQQAFDSKIIDRNKDKLVEVRRTQPTNHQNLVRLEPLQPDKLETPTRGLTIVDTDSALPLQIYGYSPFIAHSLVQTTLILDEPDESLSFYMQTTFPGILGAPIVGPDGQVIALNALAYPGKPEISLAIPSAALRTYVFGLK